MRFDRWAGERAMLPRLSGIFQRFRFVSRFGRSRCLVSPREPRHTISRFFRTGSARVNGSEAARGRSRVPVRGARVHRPALARARAQRRVRVRRDLRRTPPVRQWFDALVARGWSVPSWPVEFGGTGWTPTQHYIWDRETARAELPADESVRRADARAGAVHVGHEGAAGAAPGADPRSARAVVSGLFGTGRRFRSRRAADARGARRRPLRRRMVRRRGRAARIAPIGCSASCAPIRARRKSSRASASC